MFTVFVRDRGDRGSAPVEPGGPTGHHYSCDFKTPDDKLHSFRFTQRLSDGMFVFDANHQHQADPYGKYRITVGTSRPYTPDCPVYGSLMDLLTSVFEVCEASGISGSTLYH